MIDKRTTKAIIKTIGKRYIAKICEYARENSKPFVENYTERSLGQMVSYVLNGTRGDEEIENTIIECSEFYHKKNEENKLRNKNLAKKLTA